jgi:acetyl-CoA acyltransferase
MVAGLPPETAGVTINRNCASSLQAINDAAMSIAAGCEDVQIAGGVEHMEHVPMTKDYNPCPSLFRHHSEAIMNMGLTAEYLAAKYRIPREKQDAFALRSHQLASKATDAGEFKNEIIPTWGRDDSGRKVLLTTDQCIRRETSLESLAGLPPAFNPDGGSVTAGNASPINVGAAALLIMSEEKARELGLKPIARVRAMAVAGVNPEEMGIGPVPATQKALKRAGQPARRRHCHWAPPGGQRCTDRDHALAPDARSKSEAWSGNDVYRTGPRVHDDLRDLRELNGHA